MEEISLNGEKYIKASVIAEKLGYTADYVGQLCRSKQVDATLVGRSWYVGEKSISEHKKNRYRSTLSKSKESVRKIADERTAFRQAGYLVNKKTSYREDDSDLIPVIKKEKEADSIETDVLSRDIYPRKVESKPFNREFFGSAEKYSTHVSINTTRALPPVRIISTKAVDMNTLPKALPQRGLASMKAPSSVNGAKRKGRGVLKLLSWVFLLVVAVTISLSLVGLEKRVVLIENEGQVILYNFSFADFETLVRSYFNK